MSKDTGLEPRYSVSRIYTEVEPNGDTWAWEVPVEEFCFVLKPFSDPIAIMALERYADSAYVAGYETLSRDLKKKIREARDARRQQGD